MSPLRIALLVDDARASKYLRDLAAWIGTRKELVLSRLIVQPRDLPPRAGFAANLFGRILAAEERRLRHDGLHSDHFQRFDLSPLAPRIGAEVDLIVHCGDDSPAGPILGASRLGVLSFGQGDDRDGPAG